MANHPSDGMRKMQTAALERIVKEAENYAPESAARPLGGKVHIQGVGYVTLRAIRREIDRRREKAMERVRAEL